MVLPSFYQGNLEVGNLIIKGDTTLCSFKNKNLDIKLREGKPNSFVYFLSPQTIFSESFAIQLMFTDEQITKVVMRAYSEIEENGFAISQRHREWLIKLLGEEIGIKTQIEFDWGRITPWVDLKSGQAEIHITYF
jgi:hypothetical protein